MLSSLALRFRVGSSVDESGAVELLNTPDCRRDMAGSWLTLGGLGLLSVDGGVGLGIERGLILRGSTPSGGDRSKGLLVGNCFCSNARKSSSGSVEKAAAC